MSNKNCLLAPFLKRLLGTKKDLLQGQGALARAAGVSSSYVSQVLSGGTVPGEKAVCAFAAAMQIEDRLPELLLRACHDRLSDDENTEKARNVYLTLINRLDSSAAEAHSSVPIRTLEYFPRAFEPMVIVTGDKREDPPKTPGDVGAVSASPIDDRYLRRIPLSPDTEKISDKVFVLADDDYLRRKFGETNLLVIGSPASNHLARRINKQAVFHFAFNPETVEEIEEIIQEGIGRMKSQGPSGLNILRKEKSADLKFIMNEFKQGGIFDPLPESRKLRARSLRDGVDFASISLARNPFSESDDFVAILAAGFHLPGTVHAVRLLSEPTQFASHPFGGVVEITMTEGRWYERIEKADAHWDTQDYAPEDVIRALEDHSENPEWPLSLDEVTPLVQMLKKLVEK